MSSGPGGEGEADRKEVFGEHTPRAGSPTRLATPRSLDEKGAVFLENYLPNSRLSPESVKRANYARETNLPVVVSTRTTSPELMCSGTWTS